MAGLQDGRHQGRSKREVDQRYGDPRSRGGQPSRQPSRTPSGADHQVGDLDERHPGAGVRVGGCRLPDGA